MTLPLNSTPFGVVGRPLASQYVNCFGLAVHLQYARATAEKVARVVVRVEADQVAVQYSKENLIADREDAVDFRAGEWRVQEEANLDILLGVADFLAQHLRHEHEVVVVYPHQVVVLDILGDRLCEQAVGLHVALPCGLVKGDLTGVVVEQGPHDSVCQLVCTLESAIGVLGCLTGEAIVVSVRQLVGEHDGDGIVFLAQLSLQRLDFVLWDLETRPAIPLEGGGFGEPT
jgi:hypothetical protein